MWVYGIFCVHISKKLTFVLHLGVHTINQVIVVWILTENGYPSKTRCFPELLATTFAVGSIFSIIKRRQLWACPKKWRRFGRVQFSSTWRLQCKTPKLGRQNNSQGEILNHFLQQEELIALNDGEPTFICTNGKSVIDLVLCNANLYRLFCGLAIDYYTEMYTGAPNRGHCPVIATFNIAGNSRSTHVKDLKETNWEKWRETLEKLRSNVMAWNWRLLWCYMTMGHLAEMYQRSSQSYYTSQANNFTLKALL